MGNLPGIIQNFEQLYPCKYRSDWETYLFESKLEDFYAVRGETIVVSTIHKAKGKEFDNVFLLLNDNRDIIGNTKSTPLSLYNIDNQKITYNPTEYEKYTLLHIYFTFNGESIRKM